MSFSIKTAPRFPARNLPHLGAALSLLAAPVHLWIMQDHFAEWWVYGVFFLALANVQWAYGLALLNRPGRNLVSIGLYGTLVIIALYVVNHTTGVPFFGPHPGEPEGITAIGLLSKALEIALVFTLLALHQNQRASQPAPSLLQHQA